MDILYIFCGLIVFLILLTAFAAHFKRVLKAVVVEWTNKLGLPSIFVRVMISVNTLAALIFSSEFFARNNTTLMAKLNLQDVAEPVGVVIIAAVIAAIKFF